jgi:quercetin dioxygenase-like cupin family protein
VIVLKKGVIKMFTFNKEVTAVEAAPGIMRKVMSYTKELMVCEFTLKKGSHLPAHHHPHVQSTYVISGQLKYIIDGEEKVINDGDTALMKANQVHEIMVLEDTKVIDVFTPMRDDFIK